MLQTAQAAAAWKHRPRNRSFRAMLSRARPVKESPPIGEAVREVRPAAGQTAETFLPTRGLWQVAPRTRRKSTVTVTAPAVIAPSRGGRPDGTGSTMTKVERGAKRRREAVQTERVSVLETASVRPGTRKYYLEYWREFQSCARRGNHPLSTVAEVDAALALALEETFFEGENVGIGQKMFAATLFFDHRCSKEAGGFMPLSRRSLRGWKRLAPTHSRLPLPYEVVAFFINYLLLLGLHEVALAVPLSVELYLRPGEPFAIRAIDLVPPFGRRAGHSKWAVTLHAAENGGRQRLRSSTNQCVWTCRVSLASGLR